MAQTTLRDHLQETEDAISAGRIDEALEGCQRILRQYPESLEVQRLLGEVYLAQGQLDQAQQAFDWVLTNDPENFIAYCDRALISERRSDYETALDCYQQAYELSRDTRIRKEFNKLSQKVGQQGFMFSRAGLARLYMRGDLLPQAVQEWESVLASSPDRIDARTGLLEAYWREGLADQVEHMAAQILEEVPSCLKALLLLAYALAPKDPQKTQELLQRVEALDPDLVMAQDLFADMMASQPNDPFLTLLKKSPVGLEISQKMAAAQPAADPDKTLAFPSSALNASTSAHAFASWGGIDTVSSTNGTDGAQKNVQVQESPALPVWTSEDFPDTWRAREKSQAAAPAPQPLDIAEQMTSAMSPVDGRSVPDQAAAPSEQNEPQFEAWQAFQESQSREAQPPQPERQQPAWSDLLPVSTLESMDNWGSLGDVGAGDAASNWAASTQADDAPAPPAWLSMLTQGELKQLTGEVPAVPPSSEAKTSQEPSLQSSAPIAFDQSPVREDEAQAEAPTAEPARPEDREEEQLSFGPEWLKSLGAATIENARPAEQTHSSAEPQEQEQEEQEQERQPQADYETWSTPAAGLAEAKEQDALMTLEDLEQSLQAQGFMPLEPHSLSKVAAQENESTLPAEPQMQEVAEEPSLVEALAEFGNLELPSQAPMNAPPSSAPEPRQFSAQPEWMAALQPSSAPSPTQPLHNVPPAQSKTGAGPVFEQQAPGAIVDAPQEPTDIEATVSASIRKPPSSSSLVRESQSALPGRADALLTGELETTMRRPAVRLQPVERRSGLHERSFSVSRRRSAERTVGKAVESNVSNQQRLVRGYQYQLAGDYDEAMQEYRVIIRNAPELLSEVISNVRALLKLTPRYSAGYRVLGDAYMRQGEYLQAMEAYNKALTMARKARA
jgi:tetratricopeptide (TPR) repeat protein